VVSHAPPPRVENAGVTEAPEPLPEVAT
jgi:hypothetical protein